jgi:hypothetical protein
MSGKQNPLADGLQIRVMPEKFLPKREIFRLPYVE